MNNEEYGYIALHRKLIDWEWYQDINTKTVFIHLLLIANYEPKKWQGMEVLRGQTIISPEKLGEQIGLTRQNVRTSLKKLKSTSEITTKSTNKNTLVTITQYDSYQPKIQKLTSKLTINQPSTNHQLTTTKKEQNIKTNIYIYEEMFEKFYKSYDFFQNKEQSKELFFELLKNTTEFQPQILAQKIIEAAKWTAAYCKEKNITRKNPDTWLRNKGWKDTLTLQETNVASIKTPKNNLTPKTLGISEKIYLSYYADLIVEIKESIAYIFCPGKWSKSQHEAGTFPLKTDKELKKILKVEDVQFRLQPQVKNAA